MRPCSPLVREQWSNATREIVGWAMDDHLRSELCCDALNMALGRRGPVPGLIHHSDRGVQGGFNRSSQHPVLGGVDDDRKTEIRALDAA